MKKLMACLCVMAAFTGSFVFAESSKKADDAKSRPEKQAMETLELEGKIKVTGKDGNQIITLVTSDKKVYVLTSGGNGPMMGGPKGQDMKKDDSEDKKAENTAENTAEKKAPKGEKGDKAPGKGISVKDMAAKDGKSVKVKGFLNPDSSVFTVLSME
ncbi:hypothetical protein [Treponema sp.]|uniref:hypothetical protein n=1 Tax=Treponema sp. TaxID=166 RepID=UPI0025FC44B5|nr:hypothetical protein [Treponema sp.]MCR5217449.1 hypothetical protein [Treponema sp.]